MRTLKVANVDKIIVIEEIGTFTKRQHTLREQEDTLEARPHLPNILGIKLKSDLMIFHLKSSGPHRCAAQTGLPREVLFFTHLFKYSVDAVAMIHKRAAISQASSVTQHCLYGVGFSGMQHARVMGLQKFAPKFVKGPWGQAVWTRIRFSEKMASWNNV